LNNGRCCVPSDANQVPVGSEHETIDDVDADFQGELENETFRLLAESAITEGCEEAEEVALELDQAAGIDETEQVLAGSFSPLHPTFLTCVLARFSKTYLHLILSFTDVLVDS